MIEYKTNFCLCCGRVNVKLNDNNLCNEKQCKKLRKLSAQKISPIAMNNESKTCGIDCNCSSVEDCKFNNPHTCEKAAPQEKEMTPEEERYEIIKKHLKKLDEIGGINLFFAYHKAMEEYASIQVEAERKRIVEWCENYIEDNDVNKYEIKILQMVISKIENN